ARPALSPHRPADQLSTEVRADGYSRRDTAGRRAAHARRTPAPPDELEADRRTRPGAGAAPDRPRSAAAGLGAGLPGGGLPAKPHTLGPAPPGHRHHGARPAGRTAV